MSERQYYPAIYVCDFTSPQAALESLGITGKDAEFVVSGFVNGAEQPLVIQCFVTVKNMDVGLSAIVLHERPRGVVGLWFGLFAHLSSTPDEALASLVDELLAGEPQDPPTVDVFEWKQQQGSIH
ncbi:hypothetical protein GO998_07160 [Ralstonia syzygii]|uniref:Uncharacterized protein n=1 Tax=Ralstonia syzygii TaxID=28097 RepID=A0ABX7ZFG1_9RALS|nr:hypothetical protein [Ralstonia syzygii]QUP53559.1 hypothetical protein GO998_07160 [Ralstonia syzygii]